MYGKLPADACSFWEREACRVIALEADSAMGPAAFVSPEEASAAEERQAEEDCKDPPCGTCSCCAAHDDEEP